MADQSTGVTLPYEKQAMNGDVQEKPKLLKLAAR